MLMGSSALDPSFINLAVILFRSFSYRVVTRFHEIPSRFILKHYVFRVSS